MKKCLVCGSESNNEDSKCSVCGAILPTSVFDKRENHIKIKPCFFCGTENDPSRIRCSKCNRILKGVTVKKWATAVFPYKIVKESGEELLLEDGMVLGRAYQPEFWDVYTPRSFLRISLENNHICLEWLKERRKEAVPIGTSRKIGRTTFKIE